MPLIGGPENHQLRKRRWADHDHDPEPRLYRFYAQSPTTSSDHDTTSSRPSPLPRRTLKCARTTTESSDIHLQDDCRRFSLQSHHRILQDQNNKISPSTTITSPLLTPCHICHRKPTKKSHLDSFAQCTGCAQRTCFVCIRQCHGWDSSSNRRGPTMLAVVVDRSQQKEENKEEEEGGAKSRSSFHNHNMDDDYDHDVNDGRSRGGWDARGHQDVVCSRCCVERGPEGDVVCLGCLGGMEGL